MMSVRIQVIGCALFVTVLLTTSQALAQNLFEADFGAGSIDEFTPGGGSSTFASGLKHPSGLAFDSQGDLFVADEGTGDIYEYMNDSGMLNSSPIIFASGLYYPVGLAFNSAGGLFVANNVANTITEITPGKVQSTFASGLTQPLGLAFDSAGDLYEADQGTHNINEFINSNGILSSSPTVFASGIPEPDGLVFDGAGNLWVANVDTLYSFSAGSIFEVTPNGAETVITADPNAPEGIAFDGSGNLFVANLDSGGITEIAPDGTQSPFASTEGDALAFQNELLPVPEPSEWALIGMGAVFIGRRYLCERIH